MKQKGEKKYNQMMYQNMRL